MNILVFFDFKTCLCVSQISVDKLFAVLVCAWKLKKFDSLVKVDKKRVFSLKFFMFNYRNSTNKWIEPSFISHTKKVV